MGYTHYFPRVKNVPIKKQDWDGLCSDVQKLYEALPPEIKIMNREENPGITTTKRMIIFNGQEPDDYETFVLIRNQKEHEWSKGGPEIFNFCKTAQRPYDLLVVSTLLAAKDRLKEAIRVDSDGDVEDWEEGFRFAVKTLERDMPLREISSFKSERTLSRLEALEKEVNIFKAIQEEQEHLNQTLPEASSPKTKKEKLRM